MVKATDFGFKAVDKEERTRGDPPQPIPRFPKPNFKFHLIYQNFNLSIEEVYFWVLTHMRDDTGLVDVEKITDIFTASEQSAFWGASQQRLQIQQQNVQNYLATIGKLIKDLFQLVREMRIVDERLSLYQASNRALKVPLRQRRKSIPEEIVLRGYWVDMKDGGVKSPGSVYGLASTLGYTILPDLFFASPPLKKEEVAKYVDGLDFNLKVKDVLKKKLSAFCYWKEFTHKELENRKKFTVKYLRQHYNSIQLYISWVKPYLRNVKRLQQNFDKSLSEDIIGSFEGSITEIEVIMYKKIEGCSCRPCVVFTLEFRTSPHMDFHQDGYQHKGPVHNGRVEFWLRGYSWTDEEFQNYKKMREAETMDLMGNIDESLKEAVDALGDDLRNYLKEAGEKFPEDMMKEEEEKKKAEEIKKHMSGVADPFKSLFSGFKEIFETFVPSKGVEKDKSKPSDWKLKKDRATAAGEIVGPIWTTYKNFKKAHRMTTW